MNEKSNEILRVEDLSYSYQQDRIVLDRVSFNIKSNTKTVLLGPNGAGKSTLIYNLLGLYHPEKGDVYFQDKNIKEHDQEFLRSKMAYIFQNPDDQVIAPTVKEDIIFGPEQFNKDMNFIERKITKLAEQLQISHLLERNPRHLSYGEKRRVALAGVLIMEPEIIFFDEPLAFLDPNGKEEFKVILRQLHQQGKTLFLVTHDLDFAAEWGDYFMILNKGRLDIGSPRDIFHGSNDTFPGISTTPANIFKSFVKDEELPLTIQQSKDILEKLI